MSNNSEHEMQTHTDNQTPRGDILEECFQDRVNHITNEEILGYRVDVAVIKVFIDGPRAVLSRSEVVEGVKDKYPDLAEVPRIGDLVTHTLETGCTENHGIKLFSCHEWNYLISYRVSVPNDTARVICSMHVGFLKAFEKSNHEHFMCSSFYREVVISPDVGIYYMTLLFKLFKKDEIWSEEMYHCFLKNVLLEMSRFNADFVDCVTFLGIIGTKYELLGFQFSQHIEYFLKLFEPYGFSLYKYSINLDRFDENRNENHRLHSAGVMIEPEIIFSEKVGFQMLSLMLELLTKNSGESGLTKSDFITGIIQRCPGLESCTDLERVVSNRLLIDSSGENRFYGYFYRNDEICYFFDRLNFPIELAQNYCKIWSQFFNNFNTTRIDPAPLENFEVMNKFPRLAKYYVPLVSLIFRNIELEPNHHYISYAQLIFLRAKHSYEPLRLFICHFFILGRVDQRFVNGLLYYLIPSLVNLQMMDINLYKNTNALAFKPRSQTRGLQNKSMLRVNDDTR